MYGRLILFPCTFLETYPNVNTIHSTELLGPRTRRGRGLLLFARRSSRRLASIRIWRPRLKVLLVPLSVHLLCTPTKADVENERGLNRITAKRLSHSPHVCSSVIPSSIQYGITAVRSFSMESFHLRLLQSRIRTPKKKDAS